MNHRDINLTGDYNEMLTTQLEYTFDTRWGNFQPRVGYTRYVEDYKQVVPEAPRTSDTGTQAGPNLYQWTGSLAWQWNRWNVDVFVYYTPPYVNERMLWCSSTVLRIPNNSCERTGTPNGEYVHFDVSSLTTVDLTVTYRMDNGLRIRAGGSNVLDRAAPRTLTSSSSGSQPYDPGRWDARGQVFFLEVNWEM